MKPSLALFDFDGTVTTKDTFLEFIRFYKGSLTYYLGMVLLSPLLVLFKLKVIPNWKAKETVLTYFFKGERLSDFQQLCDAFATKIIPGIIRPKAIAELKKHLEQGHKVVVVSASAENWISAYIHSLGAGLIATRLEVVEGKITGKLLGNNCYGPEKVSRVKEEINIKEFDKIYAYGDSSGDKEMLAIATDKFYRHF